jgi:CheY-like chemotaxis protein
MDGYEVARRLRSAPEGDGLLLIAVTGYGQAEDHARTLAAGFDHHLAKPVNLDVLKQILAGNETGVDSHAQED